MTTNWPSASRLRPSRHKRGYRVRRARAGPLVVLQTRCDLCRLSFTEEDVAGVWIETGRWRSHVGECPECGTLAEFRAGYVEEAA